MTSAPSGAAAQGLPARRRQRREAQQPAQQWQRHPEHRQDRSSTVPGSTSRRGEAVALGEEGGSTNGAATVTASSSWQQRDKPLGRHVMWRLLMQQKRHLALALVSLLICVSMNLLSPVLQGMLFDVLVRGQHFSE